MRPIDADAFKQEITAYAITNNVAPSKALALCEIIDKQPTIDAEPVRYGRLISTGVCTLHCEIGECVACKGLNIVGAKYCQWCGAKMDGESEGKKHEPD